QETKAVSTPLTFNLKLQTRATLPAENKAGERPVPAHTSNAQPAASASNSASAPRPMGPGRQGSGRGGSGGGRGGSGSFAGTGRGGPGGPGRGGQGQQGQNAQAETGFQNLSLLQSAGVQADGEVAPGAPGGVDATAAGANEAFLVNGSISQDVQSRPGDGFGMGGPGGLGFGGPGGPGGPGELGGAGLADNGPGGPGGAFGGGRGGPGGPGGGFGGGGRGGFGGGRGGFGGRGPGRGPMANGRGQFGNRINRGRGQQWRLTAQYSLGNSALNARPYSFTAPQLANGQPVPKAAYAANQFGFSVGGPLEIPHLFRSDKTFWFVNYTGRRNKNGIDQIYTVPTAAERAGDFSGVPQAIYDPTTNTRFPGNVIPASRISPTANALLSFIPPPNAPGVRNNYQLIGANPNNNDNLQAVVNQNISSKDRLNANLSFQDRNSATLQSFGFRDPSDGSGLNSSLSYTHTFSRSLINNLVFSFSRSINNSYSYFSNGQNIEGELGISGTFVTPLTYGPPAISFTNFGALNDALPSVTRAQTTGINDTVTQLRGQHNISYGVLFQRRQNNLLTTQGARGSFNFTGVATQQVVDGLPVSGTGYDFADYLLDRPYKTSVNNYLDGNNSFYFRESVASAYVSDDWRWKTNLSIISGLRWEYFGPYTEKNNRMANLDVAPGYSSVAIVTPGQTGPLTSTSYPNGLIRPQYLHFSPREGVAWKPWKDKNLVVRAGYGIYYTGGVYNAFASRLALQQPFVNVVSQTTSPTNPLTLQNGFSTLPGQTIQNTFAVDPNYKPAYAQSWNALVQETVFRTYVIQIGYQGTKGTHLDVLQSPNRAPLGSALKTQENLAIPYASTFTYDLSAGNSVYNALQISFLHRMARNRSFNLTYV
ncbi:MAG TPA: hypothetical protein VHB50_11115, partial [Bryobacteraceae bacterium]|nr:hypothetical protein [Bryobacteraceae bacterium]